MEPHRAAFKTTQVQPTSVINSAMQSPTKGIDSTYSSASNKLPPLKGASIQRKKRSMLERKGSTDSNIFM